MREEKNDSQCAVVQMNCKDGNVKQNTALVIHTIKEIHSKNPRVKLIVFPEMILYGYMDFYRLKEACMQESIEGALGDIAKQCVYSQMEIVIGAPSVVQGTVFNSLYYIKKEGTYTCVYSKVHLIEAERSALTASDYYTICKTPLGRTGFLICWDAAFAEAGRLYGRNDVDAIVVCAAWEHPYLNQWRLAVAARSFDNSVPVYGSNRIGKNAIADFAGHSAVCDCIGNFVAECKEDKDDYVVVSIEQLQEKRLSDMLGTPRKELRADTYSDERIKLL